MHRFVDNHLKNYVPRVVCSIETAEQEIYTYVRAQQTVLALLNAEKSAGDRYEVFVSLYEKSAYCFQLKYMY